MQPTRKQPETATPTERTAPVPLEETTEEELDETLDQSFPASDTPAHQIEKQPTDADKAAPGRR